ncbi:MAG TPA: DUF5694 domain-containing protein [Gammaproteobacteria bacterium]|nr:DUF5694 domain-containing protein [Gammaproteobacteria bacterium]
MKFRFAMYAMLAPLIFSETAQAQVSLSALADHMAGPPTQILVLGTAHLSNAPKGFEPQSLQPLLARLAAYQPQIITIEAISGEGCALLAEYPTIYNPENVAPFCADTTAAKAATGLDVPAAVVAADKALKDWPADPTPAQRRHLAALFLASGEPASALVQWLQLPKAERHKGDGLDDALVTLLKKKRASNNEDYQLAVPLAVKLGLQRVYPIDDHTGDNIRITDQQTKGFVAAIRKAWDSTKSQMQPIEDREHDLLEHNHTLELYRYLNSPDVQQAFIASDMGAALRDDSAQHYGQMYVTGWEARNLRMAANILATFREHPGARVLTLVGATHKPWLDKILGQMPGVEIVDTEKMLGAAAQ